MVWLLVMLFATIGIAGLLRRGGEGEEVEAEDIEEIEREAFFPVSFVPHSSSRPSANRPLLHPQTSPSQIYPPNPTQHTKTLNLTLKLTRRSWKIPEKVWSARFDKLM